MKKNELLQLNEKIKPLGKSQPEDKNVLSQKKINKLFINRVHTLESIKPFICLNFYHSIKEKVQREEQSLLKVLNYETNKNEVLKKYSFVLNPQYFEQKFLKTTY